MRSDGEASVWMAIRTRRCEGRTACRQERDENTDESSRKAEKQTMIVTLLRYRCACRRLWCLSLPSFFLVCHFLCLFPPFYFCRRHKAQSCFPSVRVIIPPENPLLLPLLCRNKIKIGMRRPKILQMTAKFSRKKSAMPRTVSSHHNLAVFHNF
jgi:hypothetical protein